MKKTAIENTCYNNYLSTDKEPSGWGSIIRMDFEEAREYFKEEFNIEEDITSITEYKDKIIFYTKGNKIIEKII